MDSVIGPYDLEVFSNPLPPNAKSDAGKCKREHEGVLPRIEQMMSDPRTRQLKTLD